MKKIGTAVAASVLAAGVLTGTAQPAEAWTCAPRLGNYTPCWVTQAEFAKAEPGMTRAQVKELFGMFGHWVGGHSWWIGRDWCGHFAYPKEGGGWVYATYRDEGGDGGTLRLVVARW